MAVDAVLKI
jgi:hypothetical protein